MQIGDDLEEMQEQFNKQSARLGELDLKRKNDPGTYNSPSLIGMLTITPRHVLWEGGACPG